MIKFQENTESQSPKMKAVILAAGVGSRIKPLTDNCPKSLLKVAGKPILERMINHILECGIQEIVFVLGYLDTQIKGFVKAKYPDLKAHFIINEKYEQTNTGYSLMLTEIAMKGDGFIKFDADVVFDISVLRRLIASPFETCLCIDRDIQLDAEEVKVVSGDNNRVLKASKNVDPAEAIGESIGIEKISSKTANLLFNELRSMMSKKANQQEYYEAAYEKLISRDVPFHYIDITGLKWTEIDTLSDFDTANRMFATT